MADPSDPTSEPVKLSYATPGTETRWVTLGKYIPLEAQLIRIKLQSEGIPCNLADQNTAQGFSELIGIDVRVEVLAHDLERARDILEEVRAARGEDAEVEPYLDEDWRCSKCGSRNVSHIPQSAPMLVLSLLLMGLPQMFMNRSKRCGDCGHTWNPK